MSSERTRLTISALIIAVIILTAFALSVPHTRDIGPKLLTEERATTTPSVTVHDSFRKGTVTISGTLTAPNACTTVAAQASPIMDASSTAGILLALTYETAPGVCLELPTDVAFETRIEAPTDLPISVTVNGTPIEATSS